MRRLGVILFLIVCLSAGATVLAVPVSSKLLADASVASLRTSATDHDVYASFALNNAFSEEIREKIGTGLPVTFTYFLEVANRRPLWFDKVLLRKTVTTTVTYDTLTHQYSLSKRVNDEVTESSVAINEAEMMRWMTNLEHVRLADPTILGGVENDSLYIRVKSRLQKRFILFFIPWDVETGWEKVRLSLPADGTLRAR
ncbi:MAG TPA: DUF4390 domain-containing protein [Patescibacteria group bacterium]|nr:DUF4390 domain-containing protein [Patescibacteria group bacterium]